jgi:glutathione S-transferase
MVTLFHAPLTRSMRILWLLEELGLPYELAAVQFAPPTKPFAQPVPGGKLPAIRDGEVTMFESGAIVEYLLERYGNGRLAPKPGSPQRAAYLQWLHFAEATAFLGLATIAFHRLFKQDADTLPGAMADYETWVHGTLDVLERALAGRSYLLGDELSGADVMMGYTVWVARGLGVLGEAHPAVLAYLARLEARPAFQKALST